METQLKTPRGGARAVVVHPYGESARGIFVTRRLVACGYAVVPSPGGGIAVLAQVAGSFPALQGAHMGDAREALALAKAATRLQRRVSAMVAIGGPLAVLLDEPDGLEVPTLVVSDFVNRAMRQRARRRLPRGSRVVRASDFDAALREVVEFLDLRTAEAVRRRPARRRAGRLVPAALLASPAAMFATVPAANAAAVCMDVVDGDTLFITCEGDGAAGFELGVSDDGQILVNKVAKASLSDITVVKVVSKASNTLMLMNEQDHKFGTGLGTPDDPFVPVQLDVDLGGADDTLAWLATAGVDQFKLFTDGFDVTGDSVADHKVLGIETLKLDLLAGNDVLEGGEWQSKIVVDGGLDDDVLIGGVGDDSFKLSAGKDVLYGAGGLNDLKLFSDDSQVKIGDSLVTLADEGSETSFKQFESLSYLGGDADNKVDVAGFKLQKLDLDGGAGLNEFKLTSDDSLVTIGDSLIKLSDAGSEVAFKQFAALSYLGGALDSKVELAGVKLQKVDLDLGDGTDYLKLRTDDSSVKLTESKIELGDALSTFKYAGAESLSYLGGDADNKVEVLGFKLQKLDLDGGAGLNEFKLTSDDSLVTIGDSLIKLSDAGSEVAFKQFAALSYLGGALDSKVELAGVKLQKVDLDLGDGTDYLKLSTDDSSVKLSDALIELSDANATFKYAGADSLAYLGGVSDNKVDVSGIKLQKLDLDAAGGADLLTLSSNESLFKITDTSLILGANASIGHKAFESLAAFGGESANKIDGSLVAGLKLSFDGGGGNDVLLGGALADVLFGKLGDDVLSGGLGDDKLGGGLGNDQVSGDGGVDTVFDEGDVNFTATSTGLSGLGTDVLKSIEGLYLVGGAHDNVFDATKFKLGPVTMDGGDGDDVLLGSPYADKLLGSLGDDRLTGNQGNDSLYAGFGDDYLDGSNGTDFGDGGPGFDIGKSIEIRVNLEK